MKENQCNKCGSLYYEDPNLHICKVWKPGTALGAPVGGYKSGITKMDGVDKKNKRWDTDPINQAINTLVGMALVGKTDRDTMIDLQGFMIALDAYLDSVPDLIDQARREERAKMQGEIGELVQAAQNDSWDLSDLLDECEKIWLRD